MVWSQEEDRSLRSPRICTGPTLSPGEHTETITIVNNNNNNNNNKKKKTVSDNYLLVPTGCHKVFAVRAPVARPDDPAVNGRFLPRVRMQRELGLCVDTTNTSTEMIKKKKKEYEFRRKLLRNPSATCVLSHFIPGTTRWHALLDDTWAGSSNFVSRLPKHVSLPHLAALWRQSLSRANKQPNKTENLIPAFHFQSVFFFCFMTCWCLFPQPKSFQTPDWFSLESLFVCCWQPPVCVSVAVLLSTHSEPTCTHSLKKQNKTQSRRKKVWVTHRAVFMCTQHTHLCPHVKIKGVLFGDTQVFHLLPLTLSYEDRMGGRGARY